MAERETSTPATGDDFDADAEALADGGVKKGPTCTVTAMFDAHPDPAKVERIRGFIDDHTIIGTRLAEFVAKHGGPRPAKYNALMRHRKRAGAGVDGCGCPA